MKKAAACLLAVAMTLQGPVSPIAGNAASQQNEVSISSSYKPATPSNAESGSEENTPDDHSDAKLDLGMKNAEVKVEIRGVLPMQEASEWDVFLIKDGEHDAAQHEPLGINATALGDTATASLTFTDVAPGTYTLLVQDTAGRGYQEFRQKIEVGSERASVLLMNDYPKKYGYAGERLPGVIRMGDVNSDGNIDTFDMDSLVDAIESGDTHTVNSYCDFNGDGVVNLTDLQYFTFYYKNPEKVDSSVTKKALITPDAVIASASNATASNPDVDIETQIKDAFSGSDDAGALELKTTGGTEISEDNYIEFSAAIDQETKVEGFVIEPVVGSSNSITDGTVTVKYVDDSGTEKSADFTITNGVARHSGRSLRSARSAEEKDQFGKTIVIDLGKQVAIKKVTIKVTGTLDSGSSLADLSKVEFLNNMEDRIPEPQMDIPENLSAEAGSESFDLSWKRAVNVTNYEVEISGKTKDGIQTQVISSAPNNLSVENINNSSLVNGEDYTVRVQSVNGSWRSGYSQSITVTPEAQSVPAPPENVSVKGGYQLLNVSWKDMKNTDSYSLFYREYDDADGEFTRIDNLESTGYTIRNLKDETKYAVYLTGHNKLGEGSPSARYAGTTESVNPAITPNYKLINVPLENGVTDHIQSINNNGGDVPSEFAIADNDYVSAWVRNDWDAGSHYPDPRKSPIVTFDQSYTMDTVVLVPDPAQTRDYYSTSRLFYWTEGNPEPIQAEGSLNKKLSSNGKTYYEFQANEPFTANKVQLRLTSYSAPNARLSIAEMKFYYYDSIEHDIYDLFADDMHISLKNAVTQTELDQLRARLDVPDTVSGEYHPKKTLLSRELDTADAILNDKGLKDIIQVDTRVTSKADGHITFRGGLNSWQPLGASAMAGDTITVYVGSPNKKTGDPVNLNLKATQYHGESSAWQRDLGQLKAGPNQITIPAITAMDVEQGGSLYVEYTGKMNAEKYSVRVSGGNHIPTLDITKASDANAAMELVTEYVEDLEQTVAGMEAQHNALHGDSHGDWGRAKKNCILDATDIVTRFSMLSLSSNQILAGLNGATTEEKAKQLYNSLTAFDQMVNLFYQHKGLADVPEGKDRLPVSRLNIRYQRMFDGAFMYAGGLHIGIEWDSIPGLTKGTPIVSTPDGQYISGGYFGWGISHEIGHEINEGAYAIAEITNNYFALLAEARDTNKSIRFSYPEVYQKVTSGVEGRASSVFTQLGLYWQLHLAYDMGGYNFKIYDDVREQHKNLFFARVDSYVRSPGTAPKPGGIALNLNGDIDNKLMRLATAAAEKNILEFFERWGMKPNAETIKYAAQFEKEPRAIWFVNDEARVYVMQHGAGGSVAKGTTVNATLSYTENSNDVIIDLSNDAANQDAMLGYEIFRSEHIKNQVIKKPVGFVTVDQTQFTDSISTVNNRAFTYQVVGYDKYLNATAPVDLPPVKVSHGGVIDKSVWTVTTNMSSDEDKVDEDINPDVVDKTAINKVIDGNKDTTYTGKTTGDENPSIIIHLNKEETITGFTYTLRGAGTPIGKYKVQISQTGEDGSWTDVKSGTFNAADLAANGGSQTVYFNKDNDTWMYAYDAAYVRIIALGQKGTEISVSELELLGQTGDNIDFAQTDSIGILKDDFHAGTGESGSDATIPKGSLIFTGTYKGNPAYNVVLLYDETGTIVGGTNEEGHLLSEQIIFAEVPENGALGETSSGTWIYYIRPEHWTKEQLPKQVRAELYRVDDAHSNQGERLVSNTLFVNIPEKLPDITIQSQGTSFTNRRINHDTTTQE